MFHLDRFDTILITNRIKNGQEENLSKVIKIFKIILLLKMVI